MKQFVRNSIAILTPYILVALVCGFIFGNFPIFFLLAVLLFILTQLLQLYYFQKWCIDQSITAPSIGLNRIWKSIYSSLENRINNKHETFELNNDELQNTVLQSDCGLILIENNYIKWFNKQAGLLLKLSSSRDITTDIRYLLRFPSFLDALNEKRYGNEIVLRDWQPPIAVYLLPYGTQHLCVLIRDISRFIEIENTNQELIGNVAHELRSPLTVINGYLDILKEDKNQSKSGYLKKVLSNMQKQVVRMKVLIDDTLNIVFLESTRLRDRDQGSVDVAAMLKSILESLKIGSEQCRFDTSIESFKLHGSTSELYSVFYNLIDNAKCHSQSDEVKILWRRDDRGAYFEVVDKGIGIGDYHLPKLSKRFYRVDQARSGTKGNTGLGLSIVKHALDRHQATLEIESELGKGSTFRCCFPLSRIIEAPYATVERVAAPSADA